MSDSRAVRHAPSAQKALGIVRLACVVRAERGAKRNEPRGGRRIGIRLHFEVAFVLAEGGFKLCVVPEFQVEFDPFYADLLEIVTGPLRS